ncbi:MAG: epoxyqueuosine reductase QueH, partial [Chloroflexi bacterium]|nr:epoxyqueuosine reductase QueH [Chloroflexota bacterium]
PCAIHPVKWLREHDFEVTGLWYNPNIHPFTEHQSRLQAAQTLSKEFGFPLIVSEGYEMIDYFRAVVGHEGKRCADCYRLRLERTAQTASEKGFASFTTTLLISPYQNQQTIRDIGDEVAGKHGVTFYYHDFTDGFRESEQTAKEIGLYRQKYCGCVYSEWERFGKVKIK